MKDYRTWWEKGEDVGKWLDSCHYEKKSAFELWDVDDSNYGCFAEQQWAIEIGLAECPLEGK